MNKKSIKCLETYIVIWSDNFVLGEQNKRMMRLSIRPQISLPTDSVSSYTHGRWLNFCSGLSIHSH
jgi:hypothetical protein